MEGQIFEPSKDLSALVMNYWSLESPRERTPSINTIVPDGTMKLIFHYGDLYWHHPPDGERYLQPRCFLIGQLTRPYVVEPVGETGTFVIRFHPYGFGPFVASAKTEIEKNTPISLTRLFGIKGQNLEQNILGSNTTSERIAIVEEFLLNELRNSTAIDHIIQSVVDTILTANGQITVTDISQAMDVHRRQLVRRFSSIIGISPKQLAKTIRLQSVLKTLLAEGDSKLTDIAYTHAFYDQSHFIKDFKEFTGITPKEFYGDHLKMSLLFDRLR